MLKTRILGIIAVVMALALAACGTNVANDFPQNELTTLQACVDGWPVTTQYDNRSADTMTAQKMLRYHGSSIAADGKFGPDTEKAVKAFQDKADLTIDGKIGPNTWGKLVVVLRRGSNGELVEHLQAGLGLTVDGNYGSDTEKKVREFQQEKMGPNSVDGVVGPQTWKALLNACGGNGGGATGSRAELAKQILGNNRIELWTNSPVTSDGSDGADAQSNIQDTAKGGAAKRSSYGGAPGGSVNLSTTMLQAMLSASKSASFRVTSVAGGSHSPNSTHYKGTAFDVDTVNGARVSSSNKGFMQVCRNLGATQVYGPGDSGHSTHIHCSW